MYIFFYVSAWYSANATITTAFWVASIFFSDSDVQNIKEHLMCGRAFPTSGAS